MSKKIFSGMRPTGKLHLGHLVGALHNWVELQKQYPCIFSIVDWHAYMGEYEQSRAIRRTECFQGPRGLVHAWLELVERGLELRSVDDGVQEVRAPGLPCARSRLRRP